MLAETSISRCGNRCQAEAQAARAELRSLTPPEAGVAHALCETSLSFSYMPASRQTHICKVAGECRIRADVHACSSESAGPVLVWIHGGGLIMGGRADLPAWQRDAYLDAGYSVVAIDYRLAPETKLPAITEDVEDACRWVRERFSTILRGGSQRTAVIGHSAGGYLTLMAGLRIQPSPGALVSFYGYGDIAADWYAQPDPFYCRQPAVSRREAYALVGEKVLSEASGERHRGRFYLYCRQQGLWPREVAGHDPETEPEAFVPFCPVRNVSADYPPTLLLHGTDDTDVPYAQSVMMAEALARAGVEHEFITLRGGGHGFDGDAQDPEVARTFERVLHFLKKHLAPEPPA